MENVRSQLRTGTHLSRGFLLFGDGDKGGSGKSFKMRAVAHTLVAKEVDLVGFDADPRNSHLARFFGKTFPVQRTYLRVHDGWSALIDSLPGLDLDTGILLDLPANIGEIVEREMPRLRVGCDRSGRDVYRLWTLDEEDDCIALLSKARDVVPFSNTIVVLNGRFGPRDSFVLWDRSDTRAALLAAGGMEVYLPALPIRIRTKIRDARCSFVDAYRLELELSEIIDLDIFLHTVERNFAPLVKRLER